MGSFHTRQNKRDRLFCMFLDRFWTQAVNIWSEMFPIIMHREIEQANAHADRQQGFDKLTN
jgi:hypothetical protein